MYKPIKHIENHMFDTLKVSSKDKSTFIASIYVEGYKVVGAKKFLLASFLGYNNPLNNVKIEVDIDDIIDCLYYDDGKDLDYYGDYTQIEDLMYPQSDEEVDDKFVQWCNMKEREVC